MSILQRELTFLIALWKANLLAAMEYRVAFLAQAIGMFLNNAIYFLFWILFFQRFQTVRGWGLDEMLLLFAVVAVGFGLATFLFGNVLTLSTIISEGRLDYYLSLPRPVLLHVLAGSSSTSGLGDFVYGLCSFALAGYFTPDAIGRFVLGSLFSGLIMLAALVIAHSAAFWLGNASLLAAHTTNAIITFALYPITLFDGTAKVLLFTVLPAALVGAVPAEFVRRFSWQTLGQLALAALIFLVLAIVIFHRGLQRYESGSAIQTQV
ncbi:MAG: ABC-2 family transporter protein [Chloroflexota bacterium]|nr:ABC-2 family transporter protein [Chloroflexota bacterium]